jgi:hypothetical protein
LARHGAFLKVVGKADEMAGQEVALMADWMVVMTEVSWAALMAKLTEPAKVASSVS